MGPNPAGISRVHTLTLGPGSVISILTFAPVLSQQLGMLKFLSYTCFSLASLFKEALPQRCTLMTIHMHPSPLSLVSESFSCNTQNLKGKKGIL